ncbi:MAG: FkbM family methyltransferase [Candidatus Sulfotelmatobacter sp.]
MYLKSVLQMASLMVRFRNGRTLVERMRAAQPCEEVVLWDGTRIAHPPGRGGLLEAVVELWLERVYTAGFYAPANGNVIVDAGANVGLFAIQIARQNSRCRIVALEPFAENFQYLQTNVARACPGNVTCHEMALGGEFTKGEMKAVGSRSLDHVLQIESATANGIPVIPLAGLFDLARAQEIDFLKVDIEGSEHSVFAAASPETLGRFKRIALEYHDQIVPGTLNLLKQVLDATHQIVVRPSTMEGNGILLARRRDFKS